MKPLLLDNLKSFLSRFDEFKGSEFRHLEILSPTCFKITFAVQDKARGYDWISIEFELTGVTAANLLDNSKLTLLDMTEGIEISYNGTDFAFSILNSTFFIECSHIKYQEGRF